MTSAVSIHGTGALACALPSLNGCRLSVSIKSSSTVGFGFGPQFVFRRRHSYSFTCSLNSLRTFSNFGAANI